MKKGRRIVLRIGGGLILLPVIVVLMFLLVLTIIYNKLPSDEVFEITKKTTRNVPDSNELTILTWNIGYGGLGKEMDFFYEGGTRVRPEKGEFGKYMSGITRFLHAQDSLDFVFIQEADWYSKRSYFQDEAAEIKKVLNKDYFVVAKNYDCQYVPLPIMEPMGRVVSGIIMFSKYEPIKVERKGFGTKFSWPKQLFFLQRCFLVSRFILKNGKELVLVNTHNSTFDNGGELRREEMRKLRSFMIDEYLKGNYVITGGDWNCNPVGFRKENILSGDLVKQIDPPISSNYIPGWKFAFDPTLPTNRDVDAPYRKGRTKTTIIDFFVISPNVELVSAKTFETGFRYSDHQPLEIKIRMRENQLIHKEQE